MSAAAGTALSSFCFFLDNCSLSLLIMLGWRSERNRKPSNTVLTLRLDMLGKASWMYITAVSSQVCITHKPLNTCVCVRSWTSIFVRTSFSFSPSECFRYQFWKVLVFCPVLTSLKSSLKIKTCFFFFHYCQLISWCSFDLLDVRK